MLYLQLADDRNAWEEVDSFIWLNWQFALNQQGGPRYTGNRISRTKTDSICIIAEDLTVVEMSIVMRYLGVREVQSPVSHPGGFVRRPEFLRFQKGKKNFIHEVHGENYVSEAEARH